MTTPFLTQAEINEIVAPLTQGMAVRRWFAREGFTFKVKPNGMPLISRAHFEQVTNGYAPNSTATTTDLTQVPDAAALLNQFKNKRKAA